MDKVILKYLELTYGDRETFETEKSIGVNGVCVYYKINFVCVVFHLRLLFVYNTSIITEFVYSGQPFYTKST